MEPRVGANAGQSTTTYLVVKRATAKLQEERGGPYSNKTAAPTSERGGRCQVYWIPTTDGVLQCRTLQQVQAK